MKNYEVFYFARLLYTIYLGTKHQKYLLVEPRTHSFTAQYMWYYSRLHQVFALRRS